jgi:hypothetical protein
MDFSQLVPLKDVPNLLPIGRSGKKIDYCTIYRWCVHGAGGRKLQTKVVGGFLYTWPEAVKEFIDGRTADKGMAPPPPAVKTVAQRRREKARARKIVAAAGV